MYSSGVHCVVSVWFSLTRQLEDKPTLRATYRGGWRWAGLCRIWGTLIDRAFRRRAGARCSNLVVNSTLVATLRALLPLACLFFVRLWVSTPLRVFDGYLSGAFSLFGAPNMPLPWRTRSIATKSSSNHAEKHDPHGQKPPQQNRRRRHGQVLFKTGHPEMATMVFEDAVRDNVDELNSFSKPKLDLHNHTVSTAL